MGRLPAIFVSHGAPTFALDGGRAAAQLAMLGRELPRPAVVLIFSPHWADAPHAWPLLVAAAGASSQTSRALEGGIAHGVLSMDVFVFGATQ
ncbi:hypothetical protein [Ramlibacter sp. 2FC]|uniref:hypothetical protein n=1 Tax=Ramlibacter sp. 2FC TaxID=2502188 RepID=UPI001BB12410|nr:hypothetical protein [Ramlibacter sp. 2FC]